MTYKQTLFSLNYIVKQTLGQSSPRSCDKYKKIKIKSNRHFGNLNGEDWWVLIQSPLHPKWVATSTCWVDGSRMIWDVFSNICTCARYWDNMGPNYYNAISHTKMHQYWCTMRCFVVPLFHSTYKRPPIGSHFA